MITNVNIGKYGRLGNQIFQYASAFSLAKKLNTELWLPIESENYNTLGRYNPVINEHDYYSNDLFKLFNLKFCQKKNIDYISSKIEHYHNEANVIRYNPNFWSLPNNTALHGYFQAKEYVDEFKVDLVEELKMNDKFYDHSADKYANYKKNYNNIISLHIRRGDSLLDNFAFNAEVSIENYYNNILLNHTNNNDLVLIFSDDIDWCKNIFIGDKFVFVDHRKLNEGHLYDFSLMSMCDINIMAVSTFSWWASWLNPLNHPKKIFKPKNWWGYSLKHNDENVYRYDNWIEFDNL